MDIERDARIEIGDVVFDPHHGLIVDGRHLRLTIAERIILGALIKAGGEAVSHGALIERLGTNAMQPDNLIKVYVHRIRHRLGERASRIQNVWGYGYRWAA